jgi:hypothetical protein
MPTPVLASTQVTNSLKRSSLCAGPLVDNVYELGVLVEGPKEVIMKTTL